MQMFQKSYKRCLPLFFYTRWHQSWVYCKHTAWTYVQNIGFSIPLFNHKTNKEMISIMWHTNHTHLKKKKLNRSLKTGHLKVHKALSQYASQSRPKLMTAKQICPSLSHLGWFLGCPGLVQTHGLSGSLAPSVSWVVSPSSLPCPCFRACLYLST